MLATAEHPNRTAGCAFVITGIASPDLPLRVLNLFAQQDLTFDRVAIDRVADRYTIAVEHHALAPERAAIIAAKMQAMVLVDHVELRDLPRDR